ncbi:MAG: TIGR01777 family protein [Candidatus Sericytochromatia bacterium]|nr:TIGR01777 family protein [Candidatus Sericytochromatia bacterium]
MRIVVTGATGFIGGPLLKALIRDGHAVTVLSRTARSSPDVTYLAWDGRTVGDWAPAVDGADAVIHLAGDPIAEGRWTPAKKARIRNSRIAGTAAIVTAIERADVRPKVLISGSAVGFYGPRGTHRITEAEGPGRDFLSQVCLEWESTARLVAVSGVRLVLLRTGIVLGNAGGALAKLLPLFRMGLGGSLGSGKQGFSWIHLDDEVGLILWALENDAVSGPLNASAPEPVSNADFTRALNHAVGRPGFLPVPAFALRLGMGEQADMLLTGAYAYPQQAQDKGYTFRFPTLSTALSDIVAGT